MFTRKIIPIHVLQSLEVTACETFHKVLHVGPTEDVHEHIVKKLVVRGEAQVYPGREAVDLCPERHILYSCQRLL